MAQLLIRVHRLSKGSPIGQVVINCEYVSNGHHQLVVKGHECSQRVDD